MRSPGNSVWEKMESSRTATSCSSTHPARRATIPGASHIVVEQRPAHEVTHYAGTLTAPASTRAFNPAFDTTPAELITAVISEAGITWTKGAHT